MADKYYIMGTSLKVSLAELASSLDVCYYQYPPVLTETLGNNEHWLLESAWSFIYNRAMARVYASIDDNSNADKYESYAQEFWRTKRMDLQAEGTQ